MLGWCRANFAADAWADSRQSCERLFTPTTQSSFRQTLTVANGTAAIRDFGQDLITAGLKDEGIEIIGADGGLAFAMESDGPTVPVVLKRCNASKAR